LSHLTRNFRRTSRAPHLPRTITRHDAVYNLQRTALFTAAIAQQRYDLLWKRCAIACTSLIGNHSYPVSAEALALPRMQGTLRHRFERMLVQVSSRWSTTTSSRSALASRVVFKRVGSSRR
jgi:hypothetical protein